MSIKKELKMNKQLHTTNGVIIEWLSETEIKFSKIVASKMRSQTVKITSTKALFIFLKAFEAQNDAEWLDLATNLTV